MIIPQTTEQQSESLHEFQLEIERKLTQMSKPNAQLAVELCKEVISFWANVATLSLDDALEASQKIDEKIRDISQKGSADSLLDTLNEISQKEADKLS